MIASLTQLYCLLRSGTFFLLLTLANEKAAAQRGRDYIRQDSPPTSFSAGFPGFLDAEVAPAGGFVLEGAAVSNGAFTLPNLSVDYGLSKHFTLGTNLITPVLLAAGISNITFKMRYRWIAETAFASSLTFYGGIFAPARADSALLVRPDFGVATLNTSYKLGERVVWLAHFIGLHSTIYEGILSSLTATKAEFSALGVGSGIQLQLTSWLRLQANVLYPLYGSYTEDQATYTGMTSPALLSLAGGTPLVRTHADFRLGSNWLLALGCYTSRVEKALMLAPFASVAVTL